MKREAKGYRVLETRGVPVKAWTVGVPCDPAAERQLANAAALPIVFRWVAAMPDVHVGIGATVGAVIPTVAAIIPAAVGVDIGCGMSASLTSLTADDLPSGLGPLRAAIERAVPHGRTDSGGRNDRGAWHDPPPRVADAWRALEPGWTAYLASVRTPAAISAFNLSLAIVAIVVPLDVIFGVTTAIALVRGRFPGKGLLQALVDLPFAVSPVVVGVALITLWGIGGWFGGIENLGLKVIFGLPGMVIATLFVTLPFVVREVEPVLHEIGTSQEQAAATLGASTWQTFWRITLPAIRWGLTYGVVLTIARALGEFGAVIMVSSGLPGTSQTLTLLVHARYIDDHNTQGAYAAATLLMGLAVLVLLGMTLLERKRSRT